MAKSAFRTYANEHGGRVLLLLLLFLLAIYQFIHAGFPAFAVICLSPLLIIAVILAFRSNMLVFWVLIVVNAFLQNKNFHFPGPMSLYNEVLEILLLALALIDAKNNHFNRIYNVMLLTLMIWCGYCTLQVFNDTCNLGINVGAWYVGFRLFAQQLIFILLVFSLYISTPQKLMTYMKIWALFCLFSAFWTWKQEYIGFTDAEKLWIETRGRNTHILNAGTLIRYFSTFDNAASYGCHAAAAAAAFIIWGITNRIKKARYFFLIISA